MPVAGKSSYATMCLRELMKTTTNPNFHKSLNAAGPGELSRPCAEASVVATSDQDGAHSTVPVSSSGGHGDVSREGGDADVDGNGEEDVDGDGEGDGDGDGEGDGDGCDDEQAEDADASSKKVRLE